MQVPLEILASQWWLCLYANVLPTATLLRMWDVVLAGGGVDTLVASSLSLLRRFEPRLKETEVSCLRLLMSVDCAPHQVGGGRVPKHSNLDDE